MVSRETIVDDSGISSVFPSKLFEDFASGASLSQLTLDAAALFLCVAANKLKSNVFLSFKNEKTAYSFYLLAIGFEPDRFLFYPTPDLSEKVPGFNIESERYREESLIKLAEKNLFYVCVATRASFKEKNISIELSDMVRKWLVIKGFSETYGARPLARLIQLKIKEPIADYLLSNSPKSKILIKINLEKNNNKLRFNFITEKKKEKII